MATKHDPDYGDDRYSEEETDRRMKATIKAMIGMKPKPHEPANSRKPQVKGRKTRPAK